MYMFYDFIDTKLTNALTSTHIRERWGWYIINIEIISYYCSHRFMSSTLLNNIYASRITECLILNIKPETSIIISGFIYILAIDD